ncbi:DUF6542 domain-containing protein [Nocardia sp. NPDC049526]|uniref:DUF6542 domain-containing protein n=1 Tax=Nocardia sp. NPDC049526 TaxID=3364316 RepID=UPI00378EFC91
MAASQRVRTRVPAPHRSILPSVPGIPAGAAVLIAVACTFLGFLIDAHGENNELTATFNTLYVLGCVAAVLAVRYRGLFTTMVLPPLLLFVAVPLAYQQLTDGASTGLKDILLNLAIPLVNRFPIMALATVLVLAIGGGRILLHRREEAAGRSDESRRGTSWGRSNAAKRTKSERTGAGSLADAARRRTRRPQADTSDLDTDLHLPRPSRRGSSEVADTPPRVGGAKSARGDERPSRERRSSARPATAAARNEGEPTRAVRPAAAAARSEGEPTRAVRPAAATPRADGDSGRAAATRRRGEAPPPHPQPNVRYRERDSSRTERRRPENL